MSDKFTQFELDPYEMSDLEYFNGTKGIAFGINLKIQALILAREGLSGKLTNLYRDDGGIANARSNGLSMIKSFIPELDSDIFSCSTYEVINDGYGYYAMQGVPDVARYASVLRDVLSVYDTPDSWDEQFIEEAIDLLDDATEFEDEEDRDGVVQMLNELKGSKDSYLIRQFLEWVNETRFNGELDVDIMSKGTAYFIYAFAPGGCSRIVVSYMIRGLSLQDKELSAEIDVLRNPVSIYFEDPVCVQMGDDVFLSYIVEGDENDDCYSQRENVERPFWSLAAKRIEETIKRRGESA